jgi:hypothetical protein
MADERINNAEPTPEGAAEVAGKATGEAPAEERKPYVFAISRIMCGEVDGTYEIELFSGLRYSYDLRRYRELAEAKLAVDFLKRMLSTAVHDALSISGVPLRRIWGKADAQR